ncbi:hypothetical protein FMM01_12230 [Schleiferilactobacillus harbinensis]|nr:hypothetical protein FMM01_12230 [Schleiferilactobacillus harbinensis]
MLNPAHINIQTVLLVAGLALVVAGVWWLLGGPTGLVALGVVCIVLALIINYNRSFNMKH